MRIRPSFNRSSPARFVGVRPFATVIGAGAVFSMLAVACDKAPGDTELSLPTPPPSADTSTFSDQAARGVLGRARSANEKIAEGARAQANAASGQPAAPGTGMTPFTAVSQQPASSMIIRTGHAGIEVDSLDVAIARVRALAQRVGGFVANTSVEGGKDQLKSAALEVKIPSDRFDEALAGLAPIGRVESVNVSAQDVGEEYVDIAARVENARRLEARLIALLANRTGKLQDVLSVERELARVREEIERYEGRLRYLRARVALSTLTIAVHEKAPIIAPVAGDGPIVVAFRQAWRNFVNFIAGIIASLGILVPLGALAFVGWLGVRRWAPWRPSGGTPPAAGAVSGD